MEEKFTTVQEICDEIQTFIRLEGVVKFDDEGVRDLLHDITLYLHLIRLICTNDEILLQCLDRVDLAAVLLLG